MLLSTVCRVGACAFRRPTHQRFSAKLTKLFDKTMSVDEPIVLGSSSFTRKAILAEMGISFEVVPSTINEAAIGDRTDGSMENARKLVRLIAEAKADDIVRNLPEQHRGKILLTADQVVLCNGQILEKPKSEEQARRYLALYGDHPCHTVGSVILTDTKNLKRISGVDSTTILFSKLSPSTIDQLINQGNVYFCAGGLMIEDPSVQKYIVSVDGTIDSVMGLSKELLLRLYHELKANS
jgi:septum formation protein